MKTKKSSICENDRKKKIDLVITAKIIRNYAGTIASD